MTAPGCSTAMFDPHLLTSKAGNSTIDPMSDDYSGIPEAADRPSPLAALLISTGPLLRFVALYVVVACLVGTVIALASH